VLPDAEDLRHPRADGGRIRRQSGKVTRIGSICTGAMALAAAGLLDGKRATTHWAYCDRLAKLAPDARVELDAIFVHDEVYT